MYVLSIHLFSTSLFNIITEFAIIYFPSSPVNIDDAESRRRRQKMQEEREQQRDGNQKTGMKRATDDYHYDKFRKQFRRY